MTPRQSGQHRRETSVAERVRPLADAFLTRTLQGSDALLTAVLRAREEPERAAYLVATAAGVGRLKRVLLGGALLRSEASSAVRGTAALGLLTGAWTPALVARGSRRWWLAPVPLLGDAVAASDPRLARDIPSYGLSHGANLLALTGLLPDVWACRVAQGVAEMLVVDGLAHSRSSIDHEG